MTSDFASELQQRLAALDGSGQLPPQPAPSASKTVPVEETAAAEATPGFVAAADVFGTACRACGSFHDAAPDLFRCDSCSALVCEELTLLVPATGLRVHLSAREYFDVEDVACGLVQLWTN